MHRSHRVAFKTYLRAIFEHFIIYEDNQPKWCRLNNRDIYRVIYYLSLVCGWIIIDFYSYSLYPSGDFPRLVSKMFSALRFVCFNLSWMITVILKWIREDYVVENCIMMSGLYVYDNKPEEDSEQDEADDGQPERDDEQIVKEAEKIDIQREAEIPDKVNCSGTPLATCVKLNKEFNLIEIYNFNTCDAPYIKIKLPRKYGKAIFIKNEGDAVSIICQVLPAYGGHLIRIDWEGNTDSNLNVIRCSYPGRHNKECMKQEYIKIERKRKDIGTTANRQR